ncbi:hypothetical protein [Streptomyces antarcticus]|uniref:hypothetical protein n=1 Tax=Streptomyces antarcticus TaxID=2996458 RepID=UPI0022B02229|nr:hypothetical protein [Streptomyces sp. H34-S5]MCZ4087798.1 hypothetical protein [Streptomyces sp. H34-S5]
MTGPAPTAGERRRSRPAPWVRTRLRAAPLAALLAAALAFVAVLLAAALPRAVDRSADHALRSRLHERGPSETSLTAVASARYGQLTPADMDSVLAELRARTGGAFRLDPSGPVHGVRALQGRSLANPGLDRPEGVAPRLSLLHLPGIAAHTRLVAGRWPEGGAPGAPVPVALSRKASETLRAPLGTVLESVADLGVSDRAEVVGLYDADPADAYWTDLPCLTKACENVTVPPEPKIFWETAGVVGSDSIDRLAPWGRGADYFWRLPVDTSVLRADRMPGVEREVAAFVAGPTASALALAVKRPDLRITSRLPELFARAEARQRAAAPLAAIGPAGVAGVAAVVFCLAAALGGDRREAELRLLLARGGSRRSIVRRLLGEGAVTVLPASALACWLALVLLPAPRATASLLAASAVALLALLAFPVRAFVLLSAPRGRSPRRRLVAELLVVAATAAAVFEVRRRGIAPAGAGLDPLLVAAPLLLALSGGLFLARVQPVLVGALARAAARRRGVVGFLGLARAARGTGGRARPSVQPLVALLLAVTTAGFGVTVLGSVDSSRLEAARQAVGGDSRILAREGEPLPQELVRAAAALPGVRTSVPVWTSDDAFLFAAAQGSPTSRWSSPIRWRTPSWPGRLGAAASIRPSSRRAAPAPPCRRCSAAISSARRERPRRRCGCGSAVTNSGSGPPPWSTGRPRWTAPRRPRSCCRPGRRPRPCPGPPGPTGGSRPASPTMPGSRGWSPPPLRGRRRSSTGPPPAPASWPGWPRTRSSGRPAGCSGPRWRARRGSPCWPSC